MPMINLLSYRNQFDTSNVDEMRGIQQAKEQQRQKNENLQTG